MTLTTIGYGDVVPVTVLGRVFGAVVAVIGVGFVALPSAILVQGMLEQLALKRQADCARKKASDSAREGDASSTGAAPDVLDVLAAQQTPRAAEEASTKEPGDTVFKRCPHCGRPLDGSSGPGDGTDPGRSASAAEADRMKPDR